MSPHARANRQAGGGVETVARTHRSRRMAIALALIAVIAAALLLAIGLCRAAAVGDRQMWADRDCTPEEALRGERNEK